MLVDDNSIFLDPEVPKTLPPELVEPADVGSVEEALQVIHGWPESTTDTRSEDGTKALREPRRPLAHRALSRALISRIPFEVVELVVDCMSQEGLGVCAQVCRAWYQASVRILYKNITIATRTAFDALVDFASRDARALRKLATTSVLRIDGKDAPVHLVPVVLARMMPEVQTLVFNLSLRPLLHPTFFRTLPASCAVSSVRSRCSNWAGWERPLPSQIVHQGYVWNAWSSDGD
ncbi:uncharacterized protein B0H18DRAFT_1127022 [Fomitopsis serialis]|uniref:uncharacterized protein n=1 Tax=Fomitopsis serialis TaxID=139415 RepID=UPI0020083FFF|nr:uncharacterized protein B0H18DRAFT_1127022 [Neoantrodia serialis]KAH9912581.1 hypothetical protein B0H18DRAFT_1127022 [Neoantrodia serialis]